MAHYRRTNKRSLKARIARAIVELQPEGVKPWRSYFIDSGVLYMNVGGVLASKRVK